MFRYKPSGDPQLSTGNLVTVSRGPGERKGEQKSWKVWEPRKKGVEQRAKKKGGGNKTPTERLSLGSYVAE